MQQEVLTDIGKILTKTKGKFTGDKISADALSAADVQELSRSLSGVVNTGSFKPTRSHIPGALGRFDLNRESDVDEGINVSLLGSTNSSKTQLLRLIVSDAFAERVGRVRLSDGSEIESLLAVKNMPDTTKFIIKVPISSSVNSPFVIWDSPGVLSDNPKYDAYTRTMFDLEMLSDDPVSHVPIINIVTNIGPEKSQAIYEEVPIDEIANRFPFDTAIVIFMLNAVTIPMPVLMQNQILKDIQRLHENFGERLFVVRSFEDALEAWDSDSRAEREEILQRIVGDVPMIRYSGKTGAGVLDIIRHTLRASGRQSSDFLPYLNAEAKGFRLTHSLHNLAGLIASGLTIGFDESIPASDLKKSLIAVVSLYAAMHYSVSESDFLNMDGDINRIVADGVSWKTVEARRRAIGFFEKMASLFGRKYYGHYRRYHINADALSETCVFLCKIVHELEKVEVPAIEDSVANAWFISRFSGSDVASALADRDAYMLHVKIGDALRDFFCEFHPMSLDLSTRIG